MGSKKKNKKIQLKKIIKISLLIVLLCIIGYILLNTLILYKNIDNSKINTELGKSTTPNLKVAFIGDQGSNENSIKVLELIRDEQADLVMHQGDFDYKFEPETWNDMVNQVLGEDYPYFGTVGNHESVIWFKYQKLFEERLEKVENVECFGNFGVTSACYYEGLFFILSGVGTKGFFYTTEFIPRFIWIRVKGIIEWPSQLLHALYIKKLLKKDKSVWQVCTWHKNQNEMQTGGKLSEVGWWAYEECRKAGAMIMTGHEHSYSRTHLMSDFENRIIASKSNALTMEPGKSIAIVSGLGGRQVRKADPGMAEKEYWAKTYNANNSGNHGALFCTFNVNQSNKAECYFKDIEKKIVDEFTLISKVNQP